MCMAQTKEIRKNTTVANKFKAIVQGLRSRWFYRWISKHVRNTPYSLSKNFKALKCTKIRGKFPVRFMSLYNAEHKAYIKHKNKNFVEKFHLNITANKNISANKKKSK